MLLFHTRRRRTICWLGPFNSCRGFLRKEGICDPKIIISKPLTMKSSPVTSVGRYGMRMWMSEYAVHSRQRSSNFIVLISLRDWRMVPIPHALHWGNATRTGERQGREIVQDWKCHNPLISRLLGLTRSWWQDDWMVAVQGLLVRWASWKEGAVISDDGGRSNDLQGSRIEGSCIWGDARFFDRRGSLSGGGSGGDRRHREQSGKVVSASGEGIGLVPTGCEPVAFMGRPCPSVAASGTCGRPVCRIVRCPILPARPRRPVHGRRARRVRR